MRAALVILVVAVGLIGSIRSRYVALLLYVWFALFRPQEWAYDAVTNLRLSVVIWIALVAPALVSGVLPNITHPLSLGTIAFVSCALLAQLNAVNPAEGWVWIQVLLTTVSVALLAVSIVDTRQKLLGFMAVVGCSIGFHAAKFGAGFLANGGVRYYSGIGGMFDANNEFALAVSRTLFLVIATAQNIDTKWLRRALFAAVPLGVLAVISTFSREGFLSLTAGALTFVVLQRRKFLSIIALVVAVTTLLVAAPIPEDYFARLETIRSYQDVQEQSALARLHVWQVGLEMAKANPFGAGVKNFELLYDRYDFLDGAFGRARSAHNTYLQVLVETGIPGFVVYVALLVYALWCSLKIRRRARTPGLSQTDQRLIATIGTASVASLAAFVVGSTFSSQMLSDLNWFGFAFIAAADRVSRTMAVNAVSVIPERVVEPWGIDDVRLIRGASPTTP